MGKRKIVLLYDCPMEECDKIWLYEELQKHGEDIVVLDTKARLSQLWRSGTAGRFREGLMMLGQIRKCLKYRKEERVFYFVWKRNSAILLNIVFSLLRVRAEIVSFNWLTPNKNSRLKFLIGNCLGNKNFWMIVNSKENVDLYKNIYGLSRTDHILCLPDVYDSKIEFTTCNESALHSDYFFTGGMSNRDFRMILEMAPRFPEYRFVIVALKEQWKFDASQIPANVKLYFNTSREVYYDLMKGAKAVIFPLLDERVAGLINICKAFQFGILCLISKTPATSLYYKNGDWYLFKPGDSEGLFQMINHVIDYDRETYLSEVRIQQDYIKRTFSPDKVVGKLLECLDR